MKLRSLIATVVLVSLMAIPAMAMTLDQARSSGAVGEKLDGYVDALKTTPDVQSLVATVNAKRKEEYQRISSQNGQSVDVVAKLAAQQIIGKLAPGSLYQAPDSGWKKR